ncbi:MAG: alpha/beta hydrolase [Streptococcus sp.]|nr:alpha/beta hydrolase [Streptococcus sp.]
MKKIKYRYLVLIVLSLLIASIALILPHVNKDKKSSETTAKKTVVSSSSSVSESSSQSSSTVQVQSPSSEVVKEEFSIDNGGKSIYGYYTAPKNYKEINLPTIVFAHGFNGSAEFGDAYAQHFAKEGYIVYSFDFSGGSPRSRSDGSIYEMSVFTEEAELTTIVQTLQKQSFVDKNNIYLLGNSQGGVVSIMTAAHLGNEIAGVFLTNPAFVLFDDAKSLFSSVDEIPERYNHKGNMVGKVYFEKSLDYNIEDTYKKVTSPVLIIQGDSDEIVPLSYAKDAEKLLVKGQLHVISGAGHMLNSQENNEAMQTIDTFLANLKK